MEFWSWVMAVILGLSAIVSPIVTAIINNKYQLKLKNIEVFELSKRTALENFIKSACDWNYSSSVGSYESFRTSKEYLYIYFQSVPNSINTLNKNDNDYFNKLSNIVQVLSKQIEKG